MRGLGFEGSFKAQVGSVQLEEIEETVFSSTFFALQNLERTFRGKVHAVLTKETSV